MFLSMFRTKMAETKERLVRVGEWGKKKVDGEGGGGIYSHFIRLVLGASIA